MSDTLFIKVFIGNKQYDFARDLDSELLKCSHGKQSIFSAMLGVASEMLFDVAMKVVEDRRDK